MSPLHSVNHRNYLWWWRDIQLHSALLTQSGQLTSLTDKILVLHLNRLPIILMVLVPQHQTTPYPQKTIRGNVTVIFFNLLQFHLFRLLYHIDIRHYGVGQTRISHLSVAVEFSQCWEQTTESSNECVQVQLGHGILQQLISKANTRGIQTPKQ